MDNRGKRFSERMTADEEKAIARRIHAAEDEANGAICDIEVAHAIISKKPDRAERTRAGAPSPATSPNTVSARRPGDARPSMTASMSRWWTSSQKAAC